MLSHRELRILRVFLQATNATHQLSTSHGQVCPITSIPFYMYLPKVVHRDWSHVKMR